MNAKQAYRLSHQQVERQLQNQYTKAYKLELKKEAKRRIYVKKTVDKLRGLADELEDTEWMHTDFRMTRN